MCRRGRIWCWRCRRRAPAVSTGQRCGRGSHIFGCTYSLSFSSSTALYSSFVRSAPVGLGLQPGHVLIFNVSARFCFRLGVPRRHRTASGEAPLVSPPPPPLLRAAMRVRASRARSLLGQWAAGGSQSPSTLSLALDSWKWSLKLKRSARSAIRMRCAMRCSLSDVCMALHAQFLQYNVSELAVFICLCIARCVYLFDLHV